VIEMNSIKFVQIFGALYLAFFLLGCQGNMTGSVIKEIPECLPPMIEVGGECCDDKNSNSICDEVELLEEDSEQKIEEDEVIQEKKIINEEEEYYSKYINITELEYDINKTYYPIKKYNFTDLERDNVTGIQKNYDIRDAGRFAILKIKKKTNYLENEDNFSNFLKRLHKLRIKNWEISANSAIDAGTVYDLNWERVKIDYEHDLEKIEILGKDSYFERHLLVFNLEGYIKSGLWESYRLIVWCTPELVVRVYPSEHWSYIYYIGDSVEPKKKYIYDMMVEQKEDMIENAKKILKICSEETEKMEFKSNEMVFYGRDGFYPNDAKIRSGEKIIVHNENENWEDLVLTITRQKPRRKTIISDEIKIGESGEVVFEEQGNYTVFNVQYVPRAYVVVE